jgi:hypothetical protein
MKTRQLGIGGNNRQGKSARSENNLLVVWLMSLDVPYITSHNVTLNICLPCSVRKSSPRFMIVAFVLIKLISKTI